MSAPAIDATITFIGAGNMASSLIAGLLKGGLPATALRVADPIAGQLIPHAANGIPTFADNNQALAGTDAVVLAVKPQVAAPVVETLALESKQLLISIVAGIDIDSLSAWSSARQPIVRCMPNTPALFGAGITALYANEHCTPEQKHHAMQILGAAGAVVWVEKESLLDAVTAVSGSGPAYFFALMEAMINTGERLGIPKAIVTQLTTQTALGAAIMARDSGDAPARLRENVTSPGGTTAAALAEFAARDFDGTVEAALQAANARAGELAHEFGAKS